VAEGTMFGKVRIRRHERGLWFRNGEFQELLGPGAYRFVRTLWDAGGETVQVVSTLDTRFEHPLLDAMLSDDLMRQSLLVVDVKDYERANVFRDGRLAWTVGPGRHAFWREPYELTVERVGGVQSQPAAMPSLSQACPVGRPD